MSTQEVKYCCVTMAFVIDEDIPEPEKPLFLTIWPGGTVELEVSGRRGYGASKITYRWRRVRDASNPLDLAGEALAVVLNGGSQYKPGDYELYSAWRRARVHKCEHGHYPPDCSKCVLLYQSEGETDAD